MKEYDAVDRSADGERLPSTEAGTVRHDGPAANPLRGLNGVASPAPRWFAQAQAAAFERFSVTVDGIAIDARAWGEKGRPGLVLLHGNAAHLGWWSFLAPLLAQDHRVIALSFSGMGESGWRACYTIDDYAAEALAAADAGGANLAGPAMLVGHSLGGAPALRIAARMPARIRGAILVDTALPGPELTDIPPKPSARIYPDLPSALDRFRLSPPQPCDNLYIVDHIARMGLKAVPGGWTWRFDRQLWGAIGLGDPWTDLAQAGVPLTLVRGELSDLTGGAMEARMRAVAPAGTPFVTVPQAYHHIMVDQPLALVACLRGLLACDTRR